MSVEEVASEETVRQIPAQVQAQVQVQAAVQARVPAQARATVAAKRYAVHPDYRVNVRSGPGTQYALVRVLAYGASVPINCQRPGQSVAGPYGTTNIWDNIANGEYISDAYVYTGSSGYVTVRCA